MASVFRPALRQGALLRTIKPSFAPRIARVAGFQTSSSRPILPPPKQVLSGDVNDPAPVPPTSPSHGSYHWTFDRLIAAGLIPLTLAPFASGSLNPVMDAVLCGTLLVHSHLGFQTIITDYVSAKHYHTMRKVCTALLYGLTALTGIGLYEFETNDVGITETIKRVWRA